MPSPLPSRTPHAVGLASRDTASYAFRMLRLCPTCGTPLPSRDAACLGCAARMGRGAVGTLIVALGLAISPAHAGEPAAAVDGSPTHPPYEDEGASGECADLVHLEPLAVLGRFTDGRIACLEERYVGDAASREQVSLLLLEDAYSKGDTSRWETLLRRHFQDFGTSDPDLTYKYARFLGKMGAPRAEEAIQWAETALSHLDAWSGDALTKRTYALLSLRANAARALWQDAIERGVSPAEVEAARTRTVALARGWKAAALPPGKAPGAPEALCAEAGSAGCTAP